MGTSPLAVLGLGFVLGVRHALDVDHLAAISTLVATRRSLGGASRLGALWGLGHTVALLVVAAGVIAFQAEIPPAVGRALELGVAVMLIALGARLLRTLWRGGRLHLHVHAHGGRVHAHPHVHAPAAAERHEHAGIGRPFLVGLVHGVAGSAGLMLAVLATIPSPALALAYVATFGAGSIGGMVAMSSLLGLPVVLATERFAPVERALRLAAGLASVGVGAALAWEIGASAGLLA